MKTIICLFMLINFFTFYTKVQEFSNTRNLMDQLTVNNFHSSWNNHLQYRLIISYNLLGSQQQTLDLLDTKITEFNRVKNNFNDEYPWVICGFITAGYLCNFWITYRESLLLKHSISAADFYMPLITPEAFPAYLYRANLWKYITRLLVIPLGIYFVHYNNSIDNAINIMTMFRSFLTQHHS